MNEASKPLDTSQETQTTTEEFGSENRWLTFYQKHENAFLALAALLLFLII